MGNFGFRHAGRKGRTADGGMNLSKTIERRNKSLRMDPHRKHPGLDSFAGHHQPMAVCRQAAKADRVPAHRVFIHVVKYATALQALIGVGGVGHRRLGTRIAARLAEFIGKQKRQRKPEISGHAICLVFKMDHPDIEAGYRMSVRLSDEASGQQNNYCQ